MTQIIFGPNTAPTEPNLDANFTELYNAINGTGSAAQKVIGTGGSGGAVGATYALLAAANLTLVDSTRSANNKVGEWLWSGGVMTGRFLNDAYSAAANWVAVTGGQAAGIASIAFNGDLLTFSNSAGSEQFRKDSSGNFMVGTTSAGTPNPGVSISPTGAVLIGNNAGSSGFTYIPFLRSGVGIGSITQSGTTAVLYNTTSDARLKKNVVDAADAGSIIDAIKVRSFDWKSIDEHVAHGFIAQELVTVAPQAVKVGDSGAEVEDPWAVDPSKLVPLLVKEIQSLRARLAAAGIA